MPEREIFIWGERVSRSSKVRVRVRVLTPSPPPSFDDFIIWLKSCYIVTPLNSCTGPSGMKLYVCKHSLGFAMLFNRYQMQDKTRSILLNERRGKGRSKKVKSALSFHWSFFLIIFIIYLFLFIVVKIFAFLKKLIWCSIDMWLILVLICLVFWCSEHTSSQTDCISDGSKKFLRKPSKMFIWSSRCIKIKQKSIEEFASKEKESKLWCSHLFHLSEKIQRNL